jgi:hypothetical protein
MSCSVRVAIIDHLITSDFNIALLMEIVESYRFEVEIKDVQTSSKSSDLIIFWDQKMKLFYMKLLEIELGEGCWERICGERLPVSF